MQKMKKKNFGKIRTRRPKLNSTTRAEQFLFPRNFQWNFDGNVHVRTQRNENKQKRNETKKNEISGHRGGGARSSVARRFRRPHQRRRYRRSAIDGRTWSTTHSPRPLFCSISSSFLMLSSRDCSVCFCVSMRSSSSFFFLEEIKKSNGFDVVG